MDALHQASSGALPLGRCVVAVLADERAFIHMNLSVNLQCMYPAKGLVASLACSSLCFSMCSSSCVPSSSTGLRSRSHIRRIVTGRCLYGGENELLSRSIECNSTGPVAEQCRYLWCLPFAMILCAFLLIIFTFHFVQDDSDFKHRSTRRCSRLVAYRSWRKIKNIK